MTSTDTAPAGVDNNVRATGAWARETVRPATLVTVETMGHNIPARYLGTAGAPWPAGYVTVKVTADRPGYIKGETITVPASRVLLRSQVYTRRGQIMVRNRPLRFVDGPAAERPERVYLGCQIRPYTGRAPMGFRWESYAAGRPLYADTMAGIRELIRRTVKAGQ